MIPAPFSADAAAGKQDHRMRNLLFDDENNTYRTMDSTKVLALLEQLDDEVDDLEEALAPLLKTALSETSSKLPLLDKAKLYVLVTYAIESVLFCESCAPIGTTLLTFGTAYLRLNGVQAREHPVFVELTRVKQYFDKIKKAEFPPERSMVVDKKAAARFIRASLVCHSCAQGRAVWMPIC